jgi:hypothetical protein
MHRLINLRLGLVIAVIGLVLSMGLTACDDDETPPGNPDKGTPDTSQVDTSPYPDTAQSDFAWPDTHPEGMWPGDSAQYDANMAPFGCRTDKDCFGLKCCPTPWGVKLCAPTCGKPKKK